MELRNRIYELVLAADDGIQLEDGSFMIEIGDLMTGNEEGSEPQYTFTPFWCMQPPSTQVSRQVRAETLPVHYGSNTFVVYIEECGCLSAEEEVISLRMADGGVWLQSMTFANRRLLNHLRVRFCPNTSTVGLPRCKMARVLQDIGIGVPENAISTWARPFAKYTGPGEFGDWEDVSVSKEGRSESDEDEVERGLREEPKW